MAVSVTEQMEVAERIEDFYILCVYEQYSMKKHVQFLQKEFNQSKIIELPEVHHTFHAKSFVVWAKTYEQNEALFYNIRMQARKETVMEIEKALVAYHFEEHPTLEKKLKNPAILDETMHELQQLIQQTTFLSDERWLTFYYDFKNQVKNWVIVKLLDHVSIEELRQMNDTDLNYLFFDFFSQQLAEKGEFMQVMTDATNAYLEKWLEEILCELKKTNQLPKILHHLQDEKTKMGEFTAQFTVENHLFVMNNLPYQLVREAIYKKNFEHHIGSPYPTAIVLKGNTEGRFEINPFVRDHALQYAWEQVGKISDIDVDVFDALCNVFLSRKRQPNELIKMTITDLLHYRGLKPKRSGDGRRGGYDHKQKIQIMQSLCNIQSIHMSLTKLLSFEKGTPQYTTLKGRTFLFKDALGQDFALSPHEPVKEIYFSLDEAFAHYLMGAGRQVALQHMKALHYHPTQQLHEKRLSRYLSWRWRTQARKADYLAPNAIRTLLDSIGIPMNERLPSRTRERLEKALDQLEADGVIQSWQYEKWDESIAEFKGWAKIWLETGIIIEPPVAILKQYATIERKTTKKVEKKKTLKEVRQQRNYSLLQLAEELQLSISELGEMERGLRPLTKKVQNWLE